MLAVARASHAAWRAFRYARSTNAVRKLTNLRSVLRGKPNWNSPINPGRPFFKNNSSLHKGAALGKYIGSVTKRPAAALAVGAGTALSLKRNRTENSSTPNTPSSHPAKKPRMAKQYKRKKQSKNYRPNKKRKTYHKSKSAKIRVKDKEPPFGEGSAKVHIKYKHQKRNKSMVYKSIANKFTNKVIDQIGNWGSAGVGTIQAVVSYDVLRPADILTYYKRMATTVNTTSGASLAFAPDVASNVNARSYKFNLEGAKVIVRNINQAPSTVELEIFLLMSKVSAATLVTGQAAWNNGLNDQAGASIANYIASPLSYQTLGTRPTDSKPFNMLWKIVKKIKVSLPPGREHIANFQLDIHRILDTEYMNTFGVVRGITYEILMIARGQPVGLTNSYIAENVATAPIKVITTLDYNVTLQMLDIFPRTSYYTDNITALTAGTSAYAQNEGTDVPVNVGIAANYA